MGQVSGRDSLTYRGLANDGGAVLGSDGKMFEVKAETAAAEEPRAFVFKAEDRDAWIKALVC